MIRQIQSPGIEIHEIDRSQYNREDFSLVGTTTLVCGFADKGPDNVINWINNIQYLQEVYGIPETEEERYFYNACYEILQKGGVLLGAKLPYRNEANNKYAYTEYTIDNQLSSIHNTEDNTLTSLAEIDSTLSTYINIQGIPKAGYIKTEDLDENLVSSTGEANKIRIVDITHSAYEKAMLVEEHDNNLRSFSSECVGIIPVITTPLNAVYFQHLLSASLEKEPYIDENGNNLEQSKNIENFRVIQDFGQITSKTNPNSVIGNEFIDDNFALKIKDNLIDTYTLETQAMEYFPTLSFIHEKQLDKQYLKQIGIVVFKVFLDNSANNKLNFKPVEAFVGSLDRLTKDDLTKSTLFIDNIVNSQSNYIRVFSTVRDRYLLDEADTIFIHNQIAVCLGLKEDMLQKNINLTRSITLPLNTILDIAKDKHRYTIDIVIDAGVSNIAFKASKSGNSSSNEHEYDSVKTATEDNRIYEITSTQSLSAWRTVVQKFTDFCGKTRKDCIFLADSPKSFCLDNEQKIIRRSSPRNTIVKNILPKLKYMTGIDSSYAAGYCDWFLGYDAYSKNSMWIPPSIKAAGVYIYTDVYYNKWDAPAGMTRGVINNVVDCAFSPQQSEADKIYLQGWNYAVNYPLNGVILEGQKTFQRKATAFDRINVRRLFLYLERQVSQVAKYFVYEGNTAYQRERFVDMIRPYFEQAVQRGGILEYYIQCDETNNTPQVIDNNEMRCTIAVKPVKTIEFIILNFICTNQSANVTETITSV